MYMCWEGLGLSRDQCERTLAAETAQAKASQ